LKNDDDVSRLTASSDADDDNFAVAIETPAKSETKAKRGSAVAKKEVMTVRKRKPDAVKVPRKEKRAKYSNEDVRNDVGKNGRTQESWYGPRTCK
jgi:hypothetical protein